MIHLRLFQLHAPPASPERDPVSLVEADDAEPAQVRDDYVIIDGGASNVAYSTIDADGNYKYSKW